ncbi:hypothetical protein LCGC14_1338580 [marine sediment metagenome]|uniref:Uncharacterized protein n=1 Tax=marine sediment metagenome TaxID=412755 RepID=A0A0F9L0N4_9ZZZZ
MSTVRTNDKLSGLNIERDASVKGWCVEVILLNNDYVRIDVTNRKLKDMEIELTCEDIALHLDDLLALLK